MTQVNCIIVDDDIFSTRVMSGFVNKTGDVVLAQSFTNAIDAINFLACNEGKCINLIFLDIEMPEINGIEFMQAVDMTQREVIVYSSQGKYALESYEYDVCDYLLKPVSYARFIKAVSRARTQIDRRKGLVTAESSEENVEEAGSFTFIKDSCGQSHKVRFSDIVSVEARENYVVVNTTKQEILVHMPMKKMLEVIPEDIVKRTHKSYAVGLRFVVKIDKDSVYAEYGQKEVKLPLSRTYGDSFKKGLC